MQDIPAGFEALFHPSYVDYAKSDTYGALGSPPHDLVYRVHAIAQPEPGVVTVCESVQGWRFLPGGRLESGETTEAALERELMEEAGSTPIGAPTYFFNTVATSRDSQPYRPHTPFPVAWWTYVVVSTNVIGPPTSPDDGELVVNVEHLPVQAAIDWLAVADPIGSEVVRLAQTLELI